ncbi:GyrI-like domain-containing protein [Paenibacillus chartarius]|uniref:GyrI-like domain-containing protein n=1 Tax=Paenibacillus chartarius TaxID=747481 RepID=A0ABV6DQW1_9BACL
MNYLDSVTKAISYIENHLTDEITTERIADQAGYSGYHFHRIFQSVTRNTVAEYVRKRRLTHAAYDVFGTRLRIVEIAVKYHFDSQEAFTRAFQSMFFITPGQFRKQASMKDTLFRTMGKHALDEGRLEHLLQGITLDPKIVDVKTLQLVGMEIRGVDPGEIAMLWNEFRRRAPGIPDRRDRDSAIYYAVVEPTGVQWELSYTACVEVSAITGRPPEGMICKALPASTYAVFTHRGSLKRIPDTYHYIYSTWFPKSGRERLDGAEFARYDSRYLGPANDDSALDLYIPVGPVKVKERKNL